MKHCKLSSSLSLGSCTTLLVLNCLIYIAAAAALALALKPSLQVDNVFYAPSDKPGPLPTVQHTM